jgi:hypothetical protein
MAELITLSVAGGIFAVSGAGLLSFTGATFQFDAPSIAAFREGLGLRIGQDVQAYSANLAALAAIGFSANIKTFLGSADFAAARTALGVGIGTDVQGYSANLATFAGITPSGDVQTLLGGASFAAIRGSLGLVIGTNVQAYSANLTTFAGISPSANLQTLLGAADFASARALLGLGVGVDVQAYDATLTSLSGRAVAGGGGALATQAYVDAAALGLAGRCTVRVATTVNGVFATAFANGQTVDGVVLSTGDRILIKNQNAPAQNGVYIVNAAGAPTRSTDFDTWDEVPGVLVTVQQGTANADSLWLSTADQGGTMGTTDITFGNPFTAGLMAGNNLNDVSNAATARGNLGLAIGVNVQAYSVNLTAFAGVAPSVNALSFLGQGNFNLMRGVLGVQPLVDVMPMMVAGKFRTKGDGTIQYWNPDQNGWQSVTLSGGPNAEMLTFSPAEP